MNKKIEQFIDLFEAENHKLNLCKFGDRKDFISRHIMDSLESSQFLAKAKKVLDLGTGGGLPGLVLAISHPKTEFTLMDSIGKKCVSVERMTKELKLTNVKVICGRAEELAHDIREKFDVVIARALAPLPTLLELASGFVRRGGLLIAYKGPNYQEELTSSKHAMLEMNLLLDKIHQYKLPDDEVRRVLMVFNKNKTLDSKYPRQNGLPKKRPL
ncbi:16S rRNA (guanine(527)-N(7))-methyltransferase RsmG [Candidatus Peregrinibacteria bacterium CG22_combo_CG10-13_8_21_14_all_44_10]|nr:MAG: 16S rRNA (guanine(527)-N(7))-methyltransferase RsmG [Candidatus Peregrinibacteria bacterium CG2_30_44_17]PIP66617.1 MAG: 16S rRNA (guanine(527)-N(7))-methyltransferase RsmG [Candidatus Peregrinibacteria bacterium CG22_combo_CG10-13_8_21_14_all_44_10]PIX79956.1 MAG: 16S rRNA (guanine(527)-N(7))-methyltransferase RsmG [Candidatus Peregrinibacteria bacterium CG_4_10_14_3_um_filter_44_21]PJB88318.1 MAG: 16S rRNA (guanine(527)-N(7))-methyltransferase RsmG [Candidatus Peregrinibacteria bacteri